MNRQLTPNGFALLPGVLSSDLLIELRQAIETQLPAYDIAGIRALTSKVPRVMELSRSPLLRALIEPVLGSEAQLVRSVLFTKSAATNWHVAWHQDLTIAVQNRIEMQGFAAWTEKEGVHHVQPPPEVLEQMLTVRVHLDPTDETNGALWVAPGSHRCGRLPAGTAAAIAEQLGYEPCIMRAGDAMLMRPMLLHASRKASSHRPRRVIHFEFSAGSLPSPLLWATAA
jgi:ectoine hydroxylase-related dioxygenase (phytanoyl-CoA dioxygenase family)